VFMDRNAIITQGLDLSSPGLEIGPSHHPVTPKQAGYDVVVLDTLSADELRAKYEVDDIDVSMIEEVDYRWRGEPYVELFGARRFSWVIASHVIEHVPDLIGFLDNCASVLTDDGVISLVIPDKRYSFDHYRSISSIGAVVDAFLEGRVQPSVGTAIDYYLSVVQRGDKIAWYKGFVGDDEFVHTFDEAKLVAEANDPYAAFPYFDPHVWCFVPTSFRLLIEDLYQLGYLPVRESSFWTTMGTEFFVQLSRHGSGFDVERIEALSTIAYELADDSYVLPPGFDRERYLALNSDVAEAHLDPVFHWLTYGAIEGRDFR